MATRYPPSSRASDYPPPQDAPGSRTSGSPIDHTLTLLLAGEVDAAMRWAAAVLEKAPSPVAMLLTCRLLDQMGRARAASEGLKLAVRMAVDQGDLPLAVAAIDDLRVLGIEVGELLDHVAAVFCRGSLRLQRADTQPLYPALPVSDFVEPLSPFLAGPALASKATQIVKDVFSRHEESAGGDLPRVLPLPLFSALAKSALREVLAELHVVTVPAGQRVITEGEDGKEAFVVVRGEVEISRGAAHGDTKFTLALARLGGGAFFGEMALLSPMPSPASATTTRPTILLSARREALMEIAADRPEIAGQLAAHCRRNSLATLGWTSQVVAAVPPVERAILAERLEMRIFETGDLLVQSGADPSGLYLIVSGEVAIVAREWGERVLLATLGAGDTVGEMELVLCRQPFADAVATRPTASLFLSREEYASLIQDHPAILHSLYAIAVQRQTETSFALKAGAAPVADDWLLDATSLHAPIDAPAQSEPSRAERVERVERVERAEPMEDLRAEVVEPSRGWSITPSRLVVTSAAPRSSRSPSKPDISARRTVPPPPPYAGPVASSLTPTTASVTPGQPPARPEGRSWGSVAGVTGATAIAASVLTVLALRSLGSAGASPSAAVRPPAAVTDLSAVAATPPTNDAPLQAPGASAGSAPAGAVGSASSSAGVGAGVAPRSPSVAAPVAGPGTKVATATAVPAGKAVATAPTPVPHRAASSPAAQADATPTPQQPASASDDEFGGRQ